MLEKQAEATDPTTDRHGHDGPSQGLVSKHLENLKLGTENQLSELCDGMAGRTVTGVTDRHRPLVEIWVSELCDDLQDGPSQARRTVVIHRFKTLQLLRIWYRERFSELRDGMAGRTVTGVTDRHRLFSGN